MGRAAVCAGGRRPAREPSAPRASLGASSRSPAAREARASLRSARRLEARPGPAAAHRHRGRSLRCPPHQWGRVAVVWFSVSSRSPARPRRRPSISHVIPLRLVQTLNWHHWNCNVFGVCRKMTTINYVRNLGGGGVVAARGHRRLALSTGWPGCLIPPSPFRAPAEPRLKPSLPLRVRNGCFWCSFRVQR